jgi:hypothetical protein
MPTSAQGSGQNEIYVDKASSILLLKYLSEFQEQMNRQNEQAQAEQHEARNDTKSTILFNNLASKGLTKNHFTFHYVIGKGGFGKVRCSHLHSELKS